MINLNIDKNKKIVEAKDKKHPTNKLKLCFQKMIVENGFLIKSFQTKGSIFSIVFLRQDKKYTIHSVLKNITHAGWKNKPEIKRIQVTNLWTNKPNFIQVNEKNEFLIYFGYYDFDNNPLIVAWDSERYSGHKTNRSCYVNLDTLLWAYNENYVSTVNSSQKVWVFKPEKFKKFLDEYEEYINN